MHGVIHYVPILTTLFSAFFAVQLLAHLRRKPGARYLRWWLAGVLAYGAGTFVESLYTLQGPSVGLLKAWYILGALLGGAPLAQGTAHLLLRPQLARRIDVVLLVLFAAGTAWVLYSPAIEPLPPAAPKGDALAMGWPRYFFSPVINTYALFMFVGGALWSAVQYRRTQGGGARYLGNIWIAVGGLLPGIGGMMSRRGYTEVLYGAELVGILLIYLGYRMMVSDRSASIHAAQQTAQA